MNNLIRGLVEKLGYLINPMFLNTSRENNKLLAFYFHGLFETARHKNMDHIDPQQNMTVAQFDEFVEYFLENNYIFILPEDLKANINKDQRYVILTFDDGYYNNILAVDILEKYKIPAVFFITIRNIIENRSFWWDVIYKFRIRQGYSIEKVRKEQNMLKLLNYRNIDEYLIKNFGSASTQPWSDIDRPFTEAEVRSLVGNPYISFGNHTFNHTILTDISLDEIKREFNKSNEYLVDFTGKFPVSLAFPNGYYSIDAIKLAEETGFKFAFTAEPRKNHLPVDNKELIQLNRFMANPKKIRNYGSFYRLGYTPGTLSSNFRRFMDSFKFQKD
jgi:peptidoglycan/xylan/chitin deacetylase (PgdA/CDA1 family)